MPEQDIMTKAIQQKMLGIMVYFKQFCEENGLVFSLAGGSCLGAVRHKGFIPWDDDVDIFMLRDDYEKLPDLWNRFADTERYSCVRSDDKINIHHTATEIKDNNTTFINRHCVDCDVHQGVMIDIIPLDAVPKGKFARLMQMVYSMAYCCFNFQRLPEHKSRFTYILTKFALGIIRSDKARYKIWKFCEKQVSKYSVDEHDTVASFGEGATIMRQYFPKKWFTEPVMAEFEGVHMPIPADPDKYLTISYGNYMQLPPDEERVCRHDTVFIDLEHSYKQYRGIIYFVNGDNK